MQHITAGIIGKGKAVAGIPPGLVGLNGILQAAGLPDDGHRAVAHGDHLAQSTGFALGRHQEQVRAGVNGHGQRLVVIQAHRHAAMILLGSPVEELLVLPVALAKNDQLHRKFHHIMKYLTNQVQTLVRHQTADDGHDRHMRLLPQPHHPLQLRLVSVLAGKIVHGVVGGNTLVGGGIVQLHVDAVEHTGELILAAAHDILQPVSEIGHFQLVGIGGRNGVDRVGAQNGAFHQVHVPVHNDGAVLCPAVVQAEQVAQGLHSKTALILNVVDGQRGLDGAEAVLPHAVILQVDGHKGSLPVVAVDDIGPKLEMGKHPHDGPGEKAEPLAVVDIAVQVRAEEILLIVQEVPGNTVLLQREQAAVAVPPGQVHIVIALELQLAAKAFLHPLVQGQHHGHLCALLRQGRRQRAGHIRQAARLAKGDSLTGRIQNLHT